jgi:hypothetical protein
MPSILTQMDSGLRLQENTKNGRINPTAKSLKLTGIPQAGRDSAQALISRGLALVFG